MKFKLAPVVLTAMLLFCMNLASAQSIIDKLGFGIEGGVQRLYGDQTSVTLSPGVDGFVSFKYLRFADLVLGLGYSQLKFGPGAGFTNDLFNLDLKSNFELVSKGIFRPVVTLGAGLISSEGVPNRKVIPAFIGGGGFKFRLSPKIDLLAGADYRLTTSDELDGPPNQGKSKDGYFSVRTGIAFYPNRQDSERPQILADERVPFYEVDDRPDSFQGFQDRSNTSDDATRAGQETKDMEEYIRLKSRIDALSQGIDSQENEIGKLRGSLDDRKRALSSMESRASTLPPKRIQRSSSMSGFSEIYEEALTNYYNKSYNEAISLFRLLLQQYPSHSLASNCQFWIAQSMYSMNRFTEAIDEFFKVLSYSRSLKKDDAIFILGKTYLKIGSGDRAKESFNRLLNEYPRSEFAAEAKNYLSRL
ncbi:MAG: tol-pal system YbgF family protein [bacterium]